MYFSRSRYQGTRSGGFNSGRLILGLLMAIFAVASYYMSSEINPVTGEKQYLSISRNQEIALGLQAAPEMARQYGGLAADPTKQARLDEIGQKLVSDSVAQETDWQYEFHLLDDDGVVNAFALPGGQIFMTEALFDKMNSDSQIAGVLAHEITHVIARHGAQRLAKMQLTQGLSAAAVLASGDYSTGQLAAMIGQIVNMKYGRDDELESDTLGVRLMHEAGYDPNAMIDVMNILAAAGKGNGAPEFFSTHPSPDNRIQHIKEAIRRVQEAV